MPIPTSIRSVALIVATVAVAASLTAQWCPARGPEELPAGVTARATLAPTGEPGEPLLLSGVVRDHDGRTPMPGVIVYAYHTNQRGAYARNRGASGLDALHGRLRGWTVTGADGRYTFQTIRPGAYPGNVEAQHIHLEVLRPGGIACEIDAVEFTDDPILAPARRATRPGYGGSGIVTPSRERDGPWRVTRDITLWNPARIDTMVLDVDSSTIAWKGTKFGGRGKHEGTVHIAPGTLLLGGAALVASTVTIPLATLEVTDIPAWEPIPRNRLRKHLLDHDFFDAARFPTAQLHIRRATRVSPGLLRIDATLTMRDSTRAIAFDARLGAAPEAGVAATAFFRINRHLWGLSYRGSSLGDDLVDDDITFRVRLVARRRSR